MTAPTALPTDIVLDVASAKKYLNMNPDRDTDDDELGEFIATAVELVELVRREVVIPIEVTETHDAIGGAVLLDRVPVLEVLAVTGEQGRGPWPVDQLTVAHEVGKLTSREVALGGPVTVHYRAGRESVPALYRQATKVILAHLWQTQRRPLGGGGTRFGSTAAADSESLTVAGWSLPRAAVELLGPPVPGVA